MDGWTNVTLETLGCGVLVERFQDALAEVMSNILDPNTEADKVREITLTVKLKPAKEERSQVGYLVHSKTKLAPPQDIGAIIYIGRDNGEIVARENHVDQGHLFNDVSNVRKMEGRQ